MSPAQASYVSGFSDSVTDSQSAFRALMDGFARPALEHAFPSRAPDWGPLRGAAVTLLLSLADHDSPVWFEEAFSESEDLHKQVAFHCGAPIVTEPDRAAFAFVSDASRLGSLERFAQGEPDFPDRSTTVVVVTRALLTKPFVFAGPGIRQPRGFGAEGLAPDFATQWRANRERFPLGVDLIFVTETTIGVLPRSVRIVGD